MRSASSTPTPRTAAMLIEHVRTRRAKGTGPATVANELVWLGVVLRAAKKAWR